MLKHKPPAVDTTLQICVVLLLTYASQAQDRCAAEVKLLISSSQAPAAITAFKLKVGGNGQVDFFDTPDLNLLSKGVIIRVRRGSNNDLTVKVRPPGHEQFVDPSPGREDFKCELDLTGDREIQSYSIRARYMKPLPPASGQDVYRLLSRGQRKLLEDTLVRIDWNQVSRIGTIQSTDWKTKAEPPFKKLALELWEWPGGSILELSTKVESGEARSALGELRQLIKARGLSESPSQRPKTSTALEMLLNTK